MRLGRNSIFSDRFVGEGLMTAGLIDQSAKIDGFKFTFLSGLSL